MRVLLDTVAYSDLMRGSRTVTGLVQRSAEVLFSSIVIGELLFGFRNGSRLEANAVQLDRFLESPYVRVLPVTPTTADRFARIASGLKRKGRPIPQHDVWIAAHALQTGADLVSPDRHFEEIEGLVLRPY